MAWKPTILLASLLISSHATPLTIPDHARPEKIAWGSCEAENVPAPIQCGNLTAPLDYTDPNSDATIELQLLKVPAKHEPKKGSILVNFGGPGLEARLTLAGVGDMLLALTGGYHDVIAHDPRGPAKTFTASCFKNSTERAALTVQARLSDLPTPSNTMALGRQWAGVGVERQGRANEYRISARDLMQIVDAVSEDGLLRYWGFSYGTVLGSTVAAMFPDRVERLILDGVMNPHQYYNAYDTEVWTDVDKVFTSFFEQCIQSPKHCALASRNQTAEQLEKAIYDLLDDAKRIPIVYEQLIIDHSFIKAFIRSSLYSPPVYPNLAAAFNALLDGNTTRFMRHWQTQMGGGGVLAGDIADDSPFAIPCSEKETGKHTLNEIMPDLETLVQTTKERYHGNFEVKTKNPLLVIGNTYDSATPFRSAQNISATFKGSALLEHGGWGHATLAQGSSCTSKTIRNYWTNGTLPEAGTKCEPDYSPFESGSLKQVLIDIGFMDKE